MQVIVNDLLVTYELRGRGKLVLMLHGWGDSHRGLADLSQFLTNRYQVLAVDLPGFGGSQAPPMAWDLDNYADFLEALLIKLDLKQLYAVIGHSNGAAIAVRATATNHLSPKRLVLLGAAGIRNPSSTKKTVLKYFTKFGKALTVILPKHQRNQLRRQLYNTVGSDRLVIPELTSTFEKVVAQDVRSDAAQLNLPVLLIYGQNDQATPVRFGQIYEQLIPNAQLQIVDHAGHFVHLDQPDKVKTLIEDFLNV